MRDAAGFAGLRLVPLEDQDVAAARRLRLDEIGVAIDRDDAEHRLIEAQRPLGVSDRERDMRQSVVS